MVNLIANVEYGFKLSPCSECCVLFLSDSPASEFYVPTFRNTLSVPYS